MEFDLARTHLSAPRLPDGYDWCPWEYALLERHVFVKYWSFHGEIDARVFPCLGDIAGCRRLMYEISRQKSFLPGSTWLIARQADSDGIPEDCGTIQGLAQSHQTGAVQNVGVVAEHRGLGLGRALVLKALQGFRDAGLQRVYLEVTGDNAPAVELYRSIGFRLARTMYKAVEIETAHSY
jgi:hypothetical protein